MALPCRGPSPGRPVRHNIRLVLQSARWPGHGPAAQNVRVDVRDALTGVWAGVEYHTVTIRSHAFSQGDLMRVGKHVMQNTVRCGYQGSKVSVMAAGNDENVDRRLRVNVPECNRARSLGHDGCWNLPGNDGAKQAVGHGEILTCAPSVRLRPYMVALLRTHDAPPLWCTVSPFLAFRCPGCVLRGS